MCLVVTMSFTVLIIFLYKFIRMKNPEPIFGVYTQRGKWYYLKYFIFLCILYIRKWRNSKGSKNGGQSTNNIEDIELLEKPLPLSEHPKAFNAVFFIGANADGFRIISGTERRHKGIVHGVLYFVIPNRGLFCLPKVPDTMLFSTKTGLEGTSFSGEGLSIEPVQAMKRWRLEYKGNIRQGEKLYQAEFNAEFTSTFKPFNFDTDLSPKSLAKSIAKEEWSSHYFDTLKRAHQSHYEQMGTIKGFVKIEDERYPLDLRGFRDYSFGFKRDWTLMHRYVFFIFFLRDGRSFSIGIISQPSTGSDLKIGYICLANGQQFAMEWCDFELYQHGENGTPPLDSAFRLKAGKYIYTVQVIVETQSEHYVGSQWEARMVERFIKVDVDGMPGYGVSEFHYNNKNGRPTEASKNDPQWYKNVMEREARYKKLEQL